MSHLFCTSHLFLITLLGREEGQSRRSKKRFPVPIAHTKIHPKPSGTFNQNIFNQFEFSFLFPWIEGMVKISLCLLLFFLCNPCPTITSGPAHSIHQMPQLGMKYASQGRQRRESRQHLCLFFSSFTRKDPPPLSCLNNQIDKVGGWPMDS